MAIRFAAAKGHAIPVLSRVQCVSAPLDAANDNADRKCRSGSIGLSIVSRETPPSANMMLHAANDSQILTDALHHFARHGLSAAEHARRNANAARLEGDVSTCSWWIAICRQLDRRMADQFERHIAAGT